MNWNQPMVVEIKMDAEIGSYQEDTDRETPIVAAKGGPSTDEGVTHLAA